MKRLFLLFALAGLSTAGYSQTKMIAHRSHSGSNSTFTLAGPDNFGETPEMAEARKKQALEKARADSAAKKAVADSLARLNPRPKKIKSKNKTISKGSN
jgi:hypothetical protein